MKIKIEPRQIFKLRRFSVKKQPIAGMNEEVLEKKLKMPEPQYNLDYLCNPSNRDAIYNNIKLRQCTGNIDEVLKLSKLPEKKKEFYEEIKKLPNNTESTVLTYHREPRILKIVGTKQQFDFTPVEFSDLTKKLKLMKTQTLGPLIGQRGYLFFGDLAELEEALIHFTIKRLSKSGFKLISVPDIIPTDIIERCGLITDKGKTLVYQLDPSYGANLSLSGTAEMALAGKLTNAELSYQDLPLKMCAVSRCFRAEASGLSEERGIYRVHQFTKVEMFVCSTPEESQNEFENLYSIQENIFSSLGLHFQIIDMPPHDLGLPAYRKIDIEGWMPGRNLYGELSSCSNCTDYQSRRLDIKYRKQNGELAYVHTLNGTACAIPRMLIALCETYQTKHSRITVPEVLVPYMRDKTLIRKQPLGDMRIYKYKPKIG